MPSITGLRSQRTDVAKSENGGAVSDHADEVAARGVAHRIGRILRDRHAGVRDTRGIGKTEVVLVRHRLRRVNRNLAGGSAS